ncbi:MAG: endonuclease MutS2 [Ruminococcaceae bacterium]|nr:endonuclease MutS2 [Oscillospiraceae bacterium]
MSDLTKALKTLEYDKVLTMLADCAETEGAKKKALSLVPKTGYSSVLALQRRTSDAKAMLRVKGMPSFGRVKDVSDAVERAEKSAILSTRELLDISDLLHTAKSLCDYAEIKMKREGEPSSIDEDFKRLILIPALERKIKNTVIAEDMIADEASPELFEIRRKIRHTNNKIKDHLQKYVSGSSFSKYLQENIVTVRNGRYVVPVKQEYKNEVKGLVHDTSGSGATIFIEPMAVVEANNELRELQSREEHEIERILSELSAECAENGESIRLNYYNVTEIAFVFAKAELSQRLDASAPELLERPAIDLIKARHPLIDRKKVVPVNVSLGGNFDTLVITGPNTGGKTVTLKTLGLFVLMTQSGLHVPAEPGSKIGIFENVLADIGDEQSIEQSLSTFSAHMVNIIDIVSKVRRGSLVLFDELGAGTDPVEGAALAIAILERIRDAGALCAATTHYAELKVYALETEGVRNASCEFNVDTLKPTYKLIIGTPGKSNAFAISKKLGLSEDIVERAGKLVNSDNRRFEYVIEKLEIARTEMEAEKEKAVSLRKEFEEYKAQAEKKISETVAEAEKEAASARAKAVNLVEGARITSERVLEELEAIKKKKESESFAKDLEEARRDIRRNLKNTDTEVNVTVNKKPENYKLPRALKKGDEVLLCDINKKGILELDPAKDGRIVVKVGLITMRTNISEVMLCEEDYISVTTDKNKRKKSPQSVYRATVSREFKPELDLRGQNGEDAWFMTDKYFDEAKVVNISTVRLIHGKGTGALKKAIWDFLKKDKRVKSYRLGMYGEGDLGVTVVELK